MSNLTVAIVLVASLGVIGASVAYSLAGAGWPTWPHWQRVCARVLRLRHRITVTDDQIYSTWWTYAAEFGADRATECTAMHWEITSADVLAVFDRERHDRGGC